ncbi:MAG: DUF4124 domain-containing protein [Deltaproteobacteria bacterium]|nr:DUF4124 domain-containing protein [Deltaproteobacteria bacterium]
MNLSDRQKILTILSSLFFIFIIFSLQSLTEAEIYKWVDEKGVMHFSDTPPSDKGAEVLTGPPVNKIGGPEPTRHTSPSISRSERMKEKNRLRKIIKDYEINIDKLRENIKQYKAKIAKLKDRKHDMWGYYKTYGSRSYYVIENYD